MNDEDSSFKFQPLLVPKSPIACSPNKNLTGSVRVAKDIAADLYNTIQKWNDLHINGAQLVKQIALLKSDDPKKYPPTLEELTINLYAIVQTLRSLKDRFVLFSSQIRALEKVEKKSLLFLSRNICGIVKLVEIIVSAYSDEFKVKEVVLENIAHSKTKDEVMFFAASWTLQAHISSSVNLNLETLLTETGHRKIS